MTENMIKTADTEKKAEDNHDGDRYVSFSDIDFSGNMKKVMGHLFHYIDGPEKDNPLWKLFKERLAKANAADVPRQDQLLLLHSHVYYMYDLFEEYDDDEAAADLAKLEQECF